MSFWNTRNLAKQYGDKTALIDAESGQIINYQQLHQNVQQAMQKIGNPAVKQLLVIETTNSIDSIIFYLAALQANHVVWLVEETLSPAIKHCLYSQYQVNKVIANGVISELSTERLALHDDLALLMNTSGSTGSPKLVRLSYGNLSSNCNSICEFLPIRENPVAITTLPFNYSFGLSMVNSHLNQGAVIVVSTDSLLTTAFWQQFGQYEVTSFYGVPYLYEMLLKLQLKRLSLEHLSYFAVAGGKLLPEKLTQLASYCQQNGKSVFNMYGQTEATARISYLAPEKALHKPDSIGQAIPAGKLWLENQQHEVINAPNETGQLCYQGENIMLGLADSVADLANGSETAVLKTGDLAYQDKEGDFFIVGRLKRFIKILSYRINLDEVEDYLANAGILGACTGADDLLHCYITSSPVATASNDCDKVMQLICSWLGFHSQYCRVIAVDELPKLASGKINYAALGDLK